MVSMSRIAVAAGAAILLFAAPALAENGCAWPKHRNAQEAVAMGSLDVQPLNQMSELVAAQGYSMTNKVQKLCSGYLLEVRRGDGSVGIVYVEPQTRTIVDVNFT